MLPFGKVFQFGIVVRDMDAAIAYYESLGIGPFKERQGVGATERTVHGRPADDMRLRVSTASMGPVQIELMQPVAGQSIPAEYLERHGEGINHLAFTTADCQAVVRAMRARGFDVITSGKIPGGGEFVYFDTDKTGGVVFEVVQPPPPSQQVSSEQNRV
jgi:4-hydroxyphenylpyruvate dioxygenase-like putative hemolysin